MRTSLLGREAKMRNLALGLQLLDPMGALVAGAIAFAFASAAIASVRSGGSGVGAATVLTVWGLVFSFGNVLTALRLILRGLGVAAFPYDALSSDTASFWFGMLLLAAGQALPFTHWHEPHTMLLGAISALALSVAVLLSLANGAFAGLHWLYRTLTSVAGALRVAGRNKARSRTLAGELLLCGGVAEGIFRDRNVAVGAPYRSEVLLYGEMSAKRGTLAVGAPGSSKTRAKIYPDLYWGLRSSPRAGALVFVTKRRATQDCYAIAAAFRVKEQIHVVGVGTGRQHMDITAGMTHESIGDAIQDGLGASHSDFWRHGPSAFVEGFIEIAKALAPATVHVSEERDTKGDIVPGGEAYDLEITGTVPTLLKLLSLDGRRLDAIFQHGFARAAELKARNTSKGEALAELLHEVKERILPLMLRDAKLGEELRQSVLPQLQPFARGPLRDAFCDPSGIDLSRLEKGHVILVEVDEAEHPRAVGTIVRMIFRRLVQMARESTASNRIGFLNPVILICDEYTNYAAAGHVQAWNTVRESNFCATVGITSISALAKQLGGDHDAANAIVANFANKFFFEIDDKATRDLARELIGQSVMMRRGQTEGTSQSRGSSWSGHPSSGSGSNRSSATSSSESLNEHLEEVLDGSVWRALGASRDHAKAIAFVRTAEGVKTDVVVLGVLDPSDGVATALPEAYGLSTMLT